MNARPLARSRRRERIENELIKGAFGGSIRFDRLAQLAGVSLRLVRDHMSRLMNSRAAWEADLVFPARLGRPIEAVAYVSLKHQCEGASGRFESACIADACVTSAAALAGPCDYVLWTCHATPSGADEWAKRLSLQPEVKTVDFKQVRVLSGHALPGWVLLPSVRRH